MTIKRIALSGAMFLMYGATMALAGSTGWLNRDSPNATGDWEMFQDHFKIECRFKGGAAIPPGTPGYHCELPKGAWCVNAETKPQGSCKDIEVRFVGNPKGAIAGGVTFKDATPWFDRDDTSGQGDFELAKDLMKVQCRLKGGGAFPAGQPGYQCAMPHGGSCYNSQTVPKNTCKDVEVNFSW